MGTSQKPKLIWNLPHLTTDNRLTGYLREAVINCTASSHNILEKGSYHLVTYMEWEE